MPRSTNWSVGTGSASGASCRRLVDSDHDADVVQATSSPQAQRAGEPSWRDSVGGWLCVASVRRLTQDHRQARARRGRRERPLDGPAGRLDPISLHDDPATDSLRRELRKAVREELGRLPEKYREPVVLCDLEGLSHQEAARRLGLRPARCRGDWARPGPSSDTA
ncbi:MAG: sigma factor-like helix-turn-helix DNA-binding protein [Isosphaeraceae bacterium]